MSADGPIPLPLVDGRELDEARREALRPGEVVCDEGGNARRLPVWFYEVGSWQTAQDTRLSEHFTLHEFMMADVREAAAVRAWPRYVPCAVTLLAAHLELLRREVGTLVWVAANGGYRSPSHALVDGSVTTHCWATAANVYRVGDEYLDSQDRIQRYAEVARRVAPGLWARPWGHDAGFSDDHLHLDLGYLRVTPRGRDDDPPA